MKRKIKKKLEVIEQYNVVADQVRAVVKISGEKGKALRYELFLPKCSPATLALLEEIRHQLVTEVAISAAEILDPKIIIKLKEQFRSKAESILSQRLERITAETKSFLIGIMLHEMLGLGKLEFLLNDPNLEEIVVSSVAEPIRIYHKKLGWLVTNLWVESEDQIQNYANIIARRVGRQITTLEPLLDAHLVTGDRANAVLYPVSCKGNTITIRKFARDPWTIVDFISNSTITSELAALIWLAVQYEMNVLISGGTASGKTSLLNVIMPFIPPNQRIITIEQTRELRLPKYLFWCPLVVRLPNPEGKGGVDMLDLMVNSLRMRPDRIILGEIRRAEEAAVLFEAMHTGHSVYATVHADDLIETIARLTNPPISVPANLMKAVNLCVVMFRDRRKGIRRLYQAGEFIPSEEAGITTVKPNLLFRWKPAVDKIVAHAKSIRFFDDLSRHTGLTQQELNQEIATKKKILEWMVKHNVRYVDDVGKLMNDYYLDPNLVLKAIHKK